MGSNCALWWSEGRSRWLCPPRYGNCTSEANLRVLRFNFSERHRKGILWSCCSLPSSFFKMGSVGRHLSSSPRDPAARILIPIVAECNHLADQKTCCAAAGGAEKCQINNLNSESRCPQSRRRTRTKQAKETAPSAASFVEEKSNFVDFFLRVGVLSLSRRILPI